MNITPCELVHNFKTVLRKKNFCVKNVMCYKETDAKLYLTHIRNESYLKEIEEKVGKKFYMLLVYYRYPNNNYLTTKSDLNLIQGIFTDCSKQCSMLCIISQ